MSRGGLGLSKAVPQKSSTRRRRLRSFGLLLSLFLGLLALLPAAQVLAVRFWNPPITGIRIQRWYEGERRSRTEWISLGHTPPMLVRCVVVSEDARFLQHDGFDTLEMQRAMKEAQHGGKSRGASTITMQCARTVFLWQGRSWLRKGLEAYYTLWMEFLLSKARILELYLNSVEMASGVYGVGAAARHHYGREPAALTRPEMAMLAALLPAPRRWDPKNPSPRLRWHQSLILRREPNLKDLKLDGLNRS